LDKQAGIFVVVEGLYSMNSDMPDLPKILDLIDQYEAILILDSAHDFGAMGKKGLGILETVAGRDLSNVVICGAFSKSFGSNGGFVAGPRVIRLQLVVFSPSYTFSNGISPIQCAIVQKCAEIIFSEEGDNLRATLRENIDHAIGAFKNQGFQTIGTPSPIVPVLIGADSLARLMCRETAKKGLLANLAEFPAVPKGKAIFRFQMMSTHTTDQISEAARILAVTRQETEILMESLQV
jgi:7-keto-8-aminopelargonate synthetase-like enzyme